MKTKLLLILSFFNLLSFAQGVKNIEWEPVPTYTTEESWNTFLEANKTINSKPDLSAFTFSDQHTIIYDNENNAYNYYELDGFIFLEKYNSLTNTWIDLNFNNLNQKLYDTTVLPTYYGSNFIKEIIINNDGYLFITYEICPLCSGIPQYGLISSKNSIINPTSFEWNSPISSFLNDEIIFTYEDNIYLINDFLYVEKKGFVNKNNENVAFQVFKSTKKTLSSKLISQEKTANIKFINNQFVGSNNEKIKIYNTIGQTIPNQNLSKNTIYILIITSTNGNISSFKMIAQ